MSLLKRIPPSEVSAAAHTIWLEKSIADTIAFQTIQIINQAYKRKFVFFNGKSSKHIVGGLFYLLGFRYADVKRQTELAHQLGTSDVTIRESYRKWLMTFPDLFLDIIVKFESDKDSRYFALKDLKECLPKSEARKD
jgi:transcription initiation factor TFIIIB Brf1 subunit/transcription initiation factor TFIIB